MIVNRDQSDIAILGDVKKYKVSIDEKNLQHIITILSSNLYSHPMQSFLREIVSNAVDSHVEARVDEPIIITITDNDLAIRDFGTGISPERFRDTFINIGSSTKRDSNGFIGYFGIGKYSSLAVADVVNITSFYNGRAYYYVMNKDIDQLHIDLLYEKDTTEHNGVEVKIPYNKKLVIEDWRTLCFIKNIYLDNEYKNTFDYSGIFSAFNKRKVYNYKSFKLLDISYPFKNCEDYTYVLVGSIPYKVDYNSLWEDDSYFKWSDTFKQVYPCLNIGDVDITPNREGLLYSERTKKALKKAYNNTINELTELWNITCNKEYEDFKEFANAIDDHHRNYLYLENIRIALPNELPYKILYKGFEEIDFKEWKDTIFAFLYNKYKNVICKYNGRKNEIQRGRNSLNFNVKELLEACTDNSKIVIAVPDAQGLSSKYIKGFLSEQFGSKTVIIIKKLQLTKYNIRTFIKERFGITTLSNSKEVHFIMKILRELLIWFNLHVKDFDIIHSTEYLQYKEANKEKGVYIRDNTKISYHIWYPDNENYTTMSDTPRDLIAYLKTYWNGHKIVYAQLDSIFIQGFRDIGYPNLVIIGLSQANYQLAEKGMFPSWIKPIESLYSEDNRTLRRMAALRYIRDRWTISTITLPFPAPIMKLSKKLVIWSNKYPHNRNFYLAKELLDVVPEEKYDKEIMALYHQLEKYIQIEQKFYSGAISNETFTWYILMKAKKIRLDYNYYKKFKSYINRIIDAV